MSFTSSGLIKQFLDFLGVTITTQTGEYLAFIITSAVFGLLALATLVFIFRLLVFIRKG